MPTKTPIAFGPALIVPAALLLLPVLGRWASGASLAVLGEFPPHLHIPVDYPRFSWVAVILIVGLAALVLGPGWRRAPTPSAPVPPPPVPAAEGPRRWPRWGIAALLWTLAWWILAWTRQSWFAWGQSYTFFPLWLGWIVVVNAAIERRTGSCLMRREPRQWFTLFGASALFWWAFEWLNRFVQNWHYLGVEDVGAVEYALHASLCFSTVLPAVAAAQEWLTSWPRLERRLAHGPRWAWLQRRWAGPVLLLAGADGLIGAGALPELFYPALWVAPLMLALGLLLIGKRDGWWTALSRGDWRATGTWALAAMLCGFWWELWNVRSAAHWIYTVPYVQRWHLFEMPALGYLGYLPFGLECALAVWTLQALRNR